MSTILSLTNCGESFEKTVMLCYYAMISDGNFYRDNKYLTFYGHNLPKKYMGLCAHGTVGFYQENLVPDGYMSFLKKNNIIDKKNTIIDDLLSRGHICERNLGLYKDDEIYCRFIEKLPIDYLCSNVKEQMLNWIHEQLPQFHVQHLYAEQNIADIVISVSKPTGLYSVYGLERDGSIGHYYLNKSQKNQIVHICKSVSRCPVLSGNSATYIFLISKRISERTIVEYREHNKSNRPNREAALHELLIKGRESIIGPKNSAYNSFFDGIPKELSMEEKGNIAFCRAFKSAIKRHEKLRNCMIEAIPNWEAR